MHFTLATLALLSNIWASRVEYRNVKRNSEALDQVMAEVDRLRAAAGLPSNEEALAREG